MRLHIIMNVVETVAKTICVESNEKKGIKNFVKLVKIGEKIKMVNEFLPIKQRPSRTGDHK